MRRAVSSFETIRRASESASPRFTILKLVCLDYQELAHGALGLYSAVSRFDWVNPHMYIVAATKGLDGAPARS
jgi:hypothetical protein